MKKNPLVEKRPHRPGLSHHHCSHAVPSFYPISPFSLFHRKVQTSLLVSDLGGQGVWVDSIAVSVFVVILVEFDKY